MDLATLLTTGTTCSKGKHESTGKYLKRLTHLNLHRKQLRKIPDLTACPNVQVVYLYDNALTGMENLEQVPHVTHLHLQNNKVEKIQGLDNLCRLQKLYLDDNCISTLEGLENNYMLEELHMSHQQIPPSTTFRFDINSIDIISRSLRVLRLSKCGIHTIESLLRLVNLQQLDLSHNQISGLEEAFALVGKLQHLVDLDLTGNPVTQETKYREKLITFSSSRLTTLDKKDIIHGQRRMMQSHLAHKYRKRQQAAPSTNQETTSSLPYQSIRSEVHMPIRARPLPRTLQTAGRTLVRTPPTGFHISGSSIHSTETK